MSIIICRCNFDHVVCIATSFQRTFTPAVCGDPAPPPHGSIGLYNSTVEGTILIFKCDEGYTPTGEMTTTCTADGNWEPNPECVMREGEVNDKLI